MNASFQDEDSLLMQRQAFIIHRQFSVSSAGINVSKIGPGINVVNWSLPISGTVFKVPHPPMLKRLSCVIVYSVPIKL